MGSIVRYHCTRQGHVIKNSELLLNNQAQEISVSRTIHTSSILFLFQSRGNKFVHNSGSRQSFLIGNGQDMLL